MYNNRYNIGVRVIFFINTTIVYVLISYIFPEYSPHVHSDTNTYRSNLLSGNKSVIFYPFEIGVFTSCGSFWGDCILKDLKTKIQLINLTMGLKYVNNKTHGKVEKASKNIRRTFIRQEYVKIGPNEYNYKIYKPVLMAESRLMFDTTHIIQVTSWNCSNNKKKNECKKSRKNCGGTIYTNVQELKK